MPTDREALTEDAMQIIAWNVLEQGAYRWPDLWDAKFKEVRAFVRALYDAIETQLAAPAVQVEPVGEVVIGPKGDVEGWTVVRWTAADGCPPVGTKLYATPPAAPAPTAAPPAPTTEEAP